MLTSSGTASPGPELVFGVFFWYLLVTVVPCLGGVLADAQHLPQRRCQAGDRHLNFHETRDNLRGYRLPVCFTLKVLLDSDRNVI